MLIAGQRSDVDFLTFQPFPQNVRPREQFDQRRVGLALDGCLAVALNQTDGASGAGKTDGRSEGDRVVTAIEQRNTERSTQVRAR